MWMALIIVLIICYTLWRLCRAIARPIMIFVREMVLDLFMTTGMSRMAAEALLSLIAIVVILIVVFN
ncbi:MAG: hypothetical protein HFJ54_02690 [Clostridia bacterium]|nr:hypothetical protein [Clostridia bacterium]